MSTGADKETKVSGQQDDPNHSSVTAIEFLGTALKEAALVFVGAFFLLSLFYALTFFHLHPEFQRFANSDAKNLLLPGSDFTPKLLGDGFIDGDNAVITKYQSGEAVLAIATNFSAEDYPFIKFDVSGLTTWSQAFVFWRQAENPGELQSLPLKRSWDGLTQVAMPFENEVYTGRVSEIAIGFFSDATSHDNNNVPLRIKSVELRTLTAAHVVEQIFKDWTNPPLWKAYSSNIVRGVHERALVYPNFAANLIAGFSIALWCFIRFVRKRRAPFTTPMLPVLLCILLYSWALTDLLRWNWRVAQVIDTQHRYSGLPLEERIRNNALRCSRFPKDCFSDLLPYY
ncbi:MAG: hypothetical protein AB8B57_12270 [Congregibacter sp.]